MKVRMIGGSITIDGKTFSGRSVSINGDQVIVDGVVQQGTLVGPVSVVVNGNVEKLEMSNGDVEVSGEVGSIRTSTGDVMCRDVKGDVITSTGDVTCGSVGGGVKTSTGDINHR